MKNFKLLFTGLLIALTVVSCNFTEWDDIEMLDVTPTLIKKVPKVFPGGNVDCSQLDIDGLVQTTGRNDYISDGKFTNEWPSGLLVKVEDGKYVSFQIDGKLDLGDGKCYKVGAVIVKGSDASNVYDYVDGFGGVIMDRGLSAPVNSSGTPAGLSNLTFCFIEVECPKPLVTAVKIIYLPVGAEYSTSAVSNGDLIFNASTGNTWCNYMGINSYPAVKEFLILRRLAVDPIAKGTITETETSMTIKIEMFEGKGQLIESFFYVGDVQGLLGDVTTCPDYNSWPKVISNDGVTATYMKMK